MDFTVVRKKWPRLTCLVINLNNWIHVHIRGRKGNSFACKGIIKKMSIKMNGKGNVITIGQNTIIKNCHFYIVGNKNTITIHDDCYLKDVEIWIEENENNVEICSGTKMTGKAQLAAIEGCSIIVGSNSLMSSEIYFRTGDSHAVVDLNGIRVNKSSDIIIGNNVWIGNRCILLKGVHLANNVIVGAGSVVTKSFLQENSVIAGNPARYVKNNVTWKYER